MIGRRRFLTISAAAALVAGPASARETWRGTALGADTEITIDNASPATARAALTAARDTLRRMERMFSLHDPSSALRMLNRDGVLPDAPVQFGVLLDEANRVHRASAGVFDPTVQPLWSLLAETAGVPAKDDLARARRLVGWQDVTWDATSARLGRPGMALTLNGIAQGFATDQVTATLRSFGLERTLVNIGEFRADAGPWKIGVDNGAGKIAATLALTDSAVATSTPSALTFESGGGHILNPQSGHSFAGWRSVTIEAATAARADAVSTAIAAAPAESAPDIFNSAEARRAFLFGHDGKLTRLG